MTECERIIEQGILPESFFEEEVRCDFLVTKERKKIWAVELDLLLEFDRVRKKHGLQYFLIYGSLLGAVRHHGFVPWDDDVDVCMRRADYEKLIQLSYSFSDPYFLQIPRFDREYYYSYVKLRNSNTTSLSKGFRYAPFNQGLSLDVFCIDEWRYDEGRVIFDQVKNLIALNSRYMKSFDPANDYYATSNKRDADERSQKIDQLLQCYHHIGNTDSFCTNIVLYGYEKSILRKTYFDGSKQMDFEGFYFPVPSNCCEVLTTIYGDFMKFPPLEERGKWHTALIDADKEYMYYVKAMKLWE